MRRLGNRGTGFIGIALIMILMLFFFSGFYVTLEMLYSNVVSKFIDSDATQEYYDSYIRPMWLSFPFFFLLSIVVWGVIQTQDAYNMSSIAGVWIVILFGFIILSGIFVSFDNWIMVVFPGLLPMDVSMVGVYENVVKPMWRTAPIGIYCMFIFFGLYMASTYAEKAGSTYVGYGGRRN